MRLFIHHNGGLGDLLLSLPVISKLRQTNELLHFAGKKDIGLFLESVNLADEITDSGSSLYMHLYSGRENKSLSSLLRNFDFAYIFSSKKNSAVAESIRKYISHTKIILTIPDDLSTHAAEYRFVQAFGQALNSFEWNSLIVLPPDIKKQAEYSLKSQGYCFDRPLTSIHAGSGGPVKCWPLERYLLLAEKLITKENHFIVLFSGEAENEAFKEQLSLFANNHSKNCLYVCGKNIATVAAFLALSDICIGNDSGISHLAGIFAKKSIVIFGPTNSAIWRPSGGDAKIVSADVQCAPCDSKTALLCGRECLLKISVEDICAEITSESRTTGFHS
ncbi:MAG: hypothetical protein HQL10_02250 [Nitrospirae bacterium]|nr:hypothetical protein [Nitrospirota bacterium]